MDLVVVDGPNVFNSVAAKLAGISDDLTLRSYLLDWLDLDRLVLATIGVDADPELGVVIFHSRKGLGRGPSRIDADRFWGRQGANRNSSCMLVDIPGHQIETYPFQCSKCGEDNTASTQSEKGLDTSIATYLLETSGRYNSVCIFSKDVDFVPPVLSLRRHGKRVFCAVDEDGPTTALVRACQSHFSLNVPFALSDFALFRCFSTGGTLDGICTVLADSDATQFRVWSVSHGTRAFMRDDAHFQIGIKHAEGAASSLKAAINPHIDKVPGLPPLVHWDERNPTLLVLTFSGPDILFEGLGRHLETVAAEAVWPTRTGDIKHII